MKNYSNIYDIDGNIIRKAGDNHRLTIDEVEKLVDDLTEKAQKNPENEVYKVYLDNAHKWLMYMYNNMSKEDIMKRLTILKDSVNEAKDAQTEAEQAKLEEIANAMEQLKNEYDNLPEMPEVATPEGTTDEQLDRPMEPDLEEPTSTVMDEYIEPIEEINDEDERNKEDICTLHSGESETDS